MSGLRNLGRRVAAGATVAVSRRKPRRALLAGATLATVAVAFGVSAHNWALAGPTSPTPPAPARKAEPFGNKVVPNSYIVTLKTRSAGAAGVHAAASNLTGTLGGVVTHTYSTALNGFAVKMNAAQAKAMAARPEVAKVEPNHVMKAADTVDNASWNVDRIDQPYRPGDTKYTFPVTASNVHAYVLDTGIHLGHSAFGGRASYGANLMDNTAIADDCVGHGTHVAGTIGGTGFGVAPGASLVAVKVIGWDNVNQVPACNGSSDEAHVIAGIDWVTTHAIKPAVANMSLSGGGHSDLITTALTNSINSGITYAVAAGNDGADSCYYSSPGDVPAAITVGATDEGDRRPAFSDFGPCVDVFAPGVNVPSAANADSGIVVASGTSMATPHVTGAAALLLAADPTLTPQQVRDAIVNRAVTGAVGNPGIGSPNKLLQIGPAPAMAPEVIRLRSRANRLIVTADPGGNARLIANRVANAGWEEFDVVDAGGGFVGLRSHANGKFVSADVAGFQPLINNRSSIGGWEMFQLIRNGDGSVSLKAKANNKYVTAEAAGTAPLIASRDQIGGWEKFDTALSDSVVSILALANNRIVTAEAAGTKPLIANRMGADGWEMFDVIDLGNGFVALRAHANNKYVSAEAAGFASLIANRAAPGGWEQFVYVNNHNGFVSFQAGANSKYVTAEAGGFAPLIARSTAIGGWEAFVISIHLFA